VHGLIAPKTAEIFLSEFIVTEQVEPATESQPDENPVKTELLFGIAVMVKEAPRAYDPLHVLPEQVSPRPVTVPGPLNVTVRFIRGSEAM